MMEHQNEMQAVIDAARAAVAAPVVHTQHGRMIIMVPGTSSDPASLETIDTEGWAPAPFRKRGTVKVFDAPSLNALMAENAGNDITVYVDRSVRSPGVVAVLNGHGASGPGWGDHRVQVAFRSTPQWDKWVGIDGKMMGQADFANFIEDNLIDIIRPAAADMLEISQFLEVTRTTNFKSVTRPKSGLVQFKNEASDAVISEMPVPDTITLFLAPLYGMTAMEVTARFRYRIVDGTLRLGVKLQRVDEIMQQIMADFVGAIVLPDGAVLVDGLPPG